MTAEDGFTQRDPLGSLTRLVGFFGTGVQGLPSASGEEAIQVVVPKNRAGALSAIATPGFSGSLIAELVVRGRVRVRYGARQPASARFRSGARRDSLLRVATDRPVAVSIIDEDGAVLAGPASLGPLCPSLMLLW